MYHHAWGLDQRQPRSQRDSELNGKWKNVQGLKNVTSFWPVDKPMENPTEDIRQPEAAGTSSFKTTIDLQRDKQQELDKLYNIFGGPQHIRKPIKCIPTLVLDKAW